MNKSLKYRNGSPTGVVNVSLRINQVFYQVLFSPSGVILERKEGPQEEEQVRYKVTKQGCSCPAFAKYEGPCKHFLAVSKLFQSLSLSLSENFI
jgi:hypothetical protein